MLTPLIVTLLMQACYATFDVHVSFAQLTANDASLVTKFLCNAVLSNGDVVVGGMTAGLTGFPTAGNYDFLLQRYSNSSTLVWTKVFGGPGEDSIAGVAVDSSDNIYVTGYAYSSPISASDVYIAKFTSSGDVLYANQYNGTAQAVPDAGTGIAVDSARGVFFVVGYTHSSNFLGLTRLGGIAGFLLQLDANTGAVITKSVHHTHPTQTVVFNAVALDSTGAAWVAGYNSANGYYGTGAVGHYDIIVHKFSPSGASAFSTLLGSNYYDISSGIVCDGNDNVYVTGTVTAGVDGQPYLGGGYNDILVTKFNSAGVKSWSRLFGSIADDRPAGIAFDHVNQLVLTTGLILGYGFYGEATPFHYHESSFLLAVNTTGHRVSSKLYPATGLYGSSATCIATRGDMLYLAGVSSGNFQGETKPGTLGVNAGFVMKIGGAVITKAPTRNPTRAPTTSPTNGPTKAPTTSPTLTPTRTPTISPTLSPTSAPTAGPTADPSADPTLAPTADPTADPSADPTLAPTAGPTADPSADPTLAPTAGPTVDPSADPTLAPTLAPTLMPSASPTVVCVQWALGDYGESCSATCSKLSRTCKEKYLKDIVTQEAFYAVVGSAVNLRSGGAVGTAESFCSLTTASALTVGAPAALSIVLSSEDHRAPVRTSCSYPASAADATLGCDAVLPLRNYRRFCPCVDQSCDGNWYLGHSGDSCDATCSSVGGVCDAEPLSSLVHADVFSSMVASAVALETNEVIGESSAAFCQQGINVLPFASAPAVVTLSFGAVNDTLCVHPTDVSTLQGSCDRAFSDPPAQRFCNCKQTTTPAVSERRTLLAAAADTPLAEPVKAAKVTPRLRGQQAAPLFV